MIEVFHGADAKTHNAFQEWRRNNTDGFHMTESLVRQFTIHYAQDRREHLAGRGCMHQGGSDNEYLEDDNSCYTTAQKVCSNDLAELVAWAKKHGCSIKSCKHCNAAPFPFPVTI